MPRRVFIAALIVSSSVAGAREGRGGDVSRRILRASPAFGGGRGRNRQIHRVLVSTHVTTAIVCWRRSVFSGGLARESLCTKVSEHFNGVERAPAILERKIFAREVTLAPVWVILAGHLVVRDSR